MILAVVEESQYVAKCLIYVTLIWSTLAPRALARGKKRASMLTHSPSCQARTFCADINQIPSQNRPHVDGFGTRLQIYGEIIKRRLNNQQRFVFTEL